MPRKSQISLVLGLALLLLSGLLYSPAYAQGELPTPTPRPTPTNIPQTIVTDAPTWGSIRGMVYADVNNDGKCVGTGLTGETPVTGVTIQFVSSDEKTVITHTSAENGAYELAAAGESYWRVTAQPAAGWVVTSQNPLYAPIYPETPLAMDVNFCVQKVTAVSLPITLPANSGSAVLLPESGAPANTGSLWLAFLGLGFILLGIGLQWRQQILQK
ncbi:MAG: hypothetical protein IPJ94_14970 [Chloroflexi bacterium]|nr:hypothetical protein [Chloroflexota bacterium]MBK8933317.1 hypothetical protein [Chloroflexota bacterium]